jgi:putative drug exporter of the RND superfamily
VRSFTQPLGQPIDDSPAPPIASNQIGGMFGSLIKNVRSIIDDQVKNGGRDVYLAHPAVVPGEAPRYVTRLDVIMRSDPFDPKSNDTLDLIELWLRQDLPRSDGGMKAVRAETYGVTVGARDLAGVTEGDRLRINGMVLASVFLILMVLVRKPWLAAYLLVTVLFSYYATLGATTLAAWCWQGRPLLEVDWRVPFFLFTILVAVGEDYNIFLMTRVDEEEKRYGPVRGVTHALERTGPIISSCGIIMAGTFASLLAGSLAEMTQLGFALTFGVLLDTFVVRPILAPAFLILLGSGRLPFLGRPNPQPADAAPALNQLRDVRSRSENRSETRS